MAMVRNSILHPGSFGDWIQQQRILRFTKNLADAAQRSAGKMNPPENVFNFGWSAALSRAQHAPKLSDLMEELRNMIWEYALPGERVIRVITHSTVQESSTGQIVTPCLSGCSCSEHHLVTVLSVKSDVDVALLRTSREARSIALKYYQLVLGHHFGSSSPTYYCPDTDKISFADPWTLYIFACGLGSGDIEAIERAATREIYIESIPEDPYNYCPTSVLKDTALLLNIGFLNYSEIIGFACMRLKSVQSVIFNRTMSAGFGKQVALDAACWKEQVKVQQGIDSFKAKWTQCKNVYQY